jgi:TP901 family phage tail tape measure protein
MSDRTENSRINIYINNAQAQKALNDLSNEYKKIRGEQKKMAVGSKEWLDKQKELNQVTQKMTEFRKSVDIANMSIKQLRDHSRQLRSIRDNLIPGTEEFKRMGKEIEKVDNKLKIVSSGKSGFGAFIQNVKNDLKGLNGMLLATAAAVGALQAFRSGMEATAKMDDQLSDIKKTTGMTKKEVMELNRELKKIDTRTSAEELRNIAKVAGQIGLAKKDIAGFTKAVDMLNVALGDEFTGGAEQVATEMGILRNTFKDIRTVRVDEDLMRIGNAINELGASGFATGPVVADFSRRIGGVGITLGLTTDQVLGLSATLQELGVSTERGGTAVVKILQRMTTKTDEFAKIAGMGTREFATLVNTDLFKAFKVVLEGSQKGGQAAVMLGNMLHDLGVDGAGASEVFAKLGTNMGLLEEKVKLAGKSLKATDSIMAEFKEKNENMAARLEKLSKAWNRLLTTSLVSKFFDTIISGAEKSVNALVNLFELLNPKREEEKAMEIYARFKKKYSQFLSDLHDEDLRKELEFQSKKARLLIQLYEQMKSSGATKLELEAAAKKAKKQRDLLDLLKQEYEFRAKNKKRDAVDLFVEPEDKEGKKRKDKAAKDAEKILKEQLAKIAKFYEELAKLEDDAYEKSLDNDHRELLAIDRKYERIYALAVEAGINTNEVQLKHAEELSKKMKEIDERRRKEGILAEEEYHQKMAESTFRIRLLEIERSGKHELDKRREVLEVTIAYTERQMEALQKVQYLTPEQKVQLETLKNELHSLKLELDGIDLKGFEEGFNYTQDIYNKMDAVREAAIENQRIREDAELARFIDNEEKKKQALEERLKSGRISQEQYERDIENINKSIDQKRAETMRKQWERDKQMRMSQIRMQMIFEAGKLIIQGIAAQAATAGVPNAQSIAAFAGAALVMAEGGIKLNSIENEQPPSFGDGGRLPFGAKHSDASGGMYVYDPATGRVVASVEAREGITPSDTVDANEPLFNYMLQNRGKRVTPEVLSTLQPSANYGRAVQNSVLEKSGALNNAVSQKYMPTSERTIQPKEVVVKMVLNDLEDAKNDLAFVKEFNTFD